MSTAVLISGQARTGRFTFLNQYWLVLRHLEDPTFFVSVTDDADAAPLRACLLSRFPAARVHFETLAQPELPEPPGSPFQPGHPSFHAPMAISSPVQAVLRQLWHLHRVWVFAEGLADLGSFSLIVRLRPDLWFHRFHAASCYEVSPSAAHVPYWGTYGGINDRFALLGTRAAREYFTTYAKLAALTALGCPLHPESLIAASLETGGCDICPTLQTEFSTLRADSTFVHPDIRGSDIVAALHHAKP